MFSHVIIKPNTSVTTVCITQSLNADSRWSAADWLWEQISGVLAIHSHGVSKGRGLRPSQRCGNNTHGPWTGGPRRGGGSRRRRRVKHDFCVGTEAARSRRRRRRQVCKETGGSTLLRIMRRINPLDVRSYVRTHDRVPFNRASLPEVTDAAAPRRPVRSSGQSRQAAFLYTGIWCRLIQSDVCDLGVRSSHVAWITVDIRQG